MKMLFIILFSGLVMAQNNLPKTVNNVDLKRYVGLWYEISKIPNRFQSDCKKNTTAEYKINSDGTIHVINSCTEDDGKRNIADGLAQVVDKKTNSKLEVSFFSILGIRPVWGDYWILGVGDNYEFAVVGDPKKKYGWILSRTKVLPKDKLDKAFSILKENGYERNRFVSTQQD